MAAGLTMIGLLLGAWPCLADDGLVARYDSDTSFVFSVSGLKDAVSVVVTVGYDGALLQNPVASKGLFVSRSQFDSVNGEGSISITVSRPSTFPLSGSGALANLRFGAVGELPGKLTFLSGYYLDRADRQTNLSGTIVNPPERAARTEADNTAAPEKPVPPVKCVLPRTEALAAAGTSEPQASTEAPPTGVGAAPGSVTRYPSVLERFRTATGPVDEATGRNFFRREDAGVRQYPEVSLSDGTTPLTVSVSPEVVTTATPFFDLDGVHLVHLSVDADNRWVLTLLPNPGSFRAQLRVLDGLKVIEFPLTVAPTLDRVPPECPEYLRHFIILANHLASCPEGAD